MVEAKMNERANALREMKHLCEEFGFTAGVVSQSLTCLKVPRSYESQIWNHSIKAVLRFCL